MSDQWDAWSAVIRTILLAIMAGSGFAARAETGAFESWLMLNWSQRLPYSLEIEMEVEQHFADESPYYTDLELTPMLVWNYSPRWDFGVGYQRRWERFNQRDMEKANEAVLYALLKVPLQDWLVTSRQRFQIGDLDGMFNAFVRHEVLIEYQGLRGLPFRLMPFLSDEWFYSFTQGRVFENRLTLGLAYEVNDMWRVEVFGMRDDRFLMDGTDLVVPVFGMRVMASF